MAGTQLAPFSNELFTGLFAAFDKPGSHENEYVMKALMRSFSTLQEASIPFMGHALPKLTEILTQVAKVKATIQSLSFRDILIEY